VKITDGDKWGWGGRSWKIQAGVKTLSVTFFFPVIFLIKVKTKVFCVFFHWFHNLFMLIIDSVFNSGLPLTQLWAPHPAVTWGFAH
jgi:hypothetical protein